MGAVAILVELAVGITVCFETVGGLDSDTTETGTLVDKSDPAKLEKVKPVESNVVDNEVVDKIRLLKGREKPDNTEGASVFLGVGDGGCPLVREEALDMLWWYVATCGL
jgi:hypothetical protein